MKINLNFTNIIAEELEGFIEGFRMEFGILLWNHKQIDDYTYKERVQMRYFLYNSVYIEHMNLWCDDES